MILKYYLQVNLLIAAAYLIFLVCRLAISRIRVRPRYQAITRAAQILLITSFLVPAVFSFVPERHMRSFDFEMPRPVAEALSFRKVKDKKSASRPAVKLEANAGEKDEVANRSLLTKVTDFCSELNRPEVLFLLLAGCLVAFARFTKNIWSIRKIVSDGLVIREFGRVTIIVSDLISSPFSTLSGLRAYAVVPPEILQNSKDFRLAIQHEFQHHRQRDTAWALFIEVWVCLFFANPAIYLWKKQITELQEFSCDEALIGQRGVESHDYGSCLIRVAEAALGNRQMLVGTACMAAATKNSRYFKSFLRRRIEMFTVHEKRHWKKSTAIILGTLSIFTTLAVAYGASQALRSQPITKPNPGTAVFNPTVQAIAEDVLNKAVQSYRAKGGFVLVSDPLTGKLLAAANVSQVPARNGKSWSLSYRLEPASVMKGLVSASAVQNQVASFDETFDCGDGEYRYGHNLFHDWKAFGKLTATGTVVNSSNICGIKIGERLGAKGLEKTLSDFGFGSGGTTDGFPEALAGDIPTANQTDEEEYIAMTSVGFSVHVPFLVTPLEIVQAYGAIANDGKLMKPIGAQDSESSATVVRQVLSAQTALAARGVLQKVVLEGTGSKAQSRLYTTAGKTGTAYTPGTTSNNWIGGERAIGSFVGFAPATHPRVAIYVGIIDPKNSEDHEPHGNEHAAPVFREVAEKVLQYMNVPTDK